MKIQVEVDIELSAKAVYRNNQIKLSVSGTMPYGNGRTAGASVDGASEKVTEMFSKAFEALLKEQSEQVVKLAQAAQAESLTVAARMKEL